MKKFLFFAAALLCLVACNQKEEVAAPLEPGKPCTLTATVNFGESNQVAPRMIAPNTPIPTTEDADVNFTWEEGDSVILVNGSEREVFRLASGAGTKTATFTGTALSDMSSYEVYTFDNTKIQQYVNYLKDSFKPFAKGSGSGDSFTIDKFYPVLHFGIYTSERDGEGQAKSEVFFENITCYCEGVGYTYFNFDSKITIKTGDLFEVYCPLSFVTTDEWKIEIGGHTPYTSSIDEDKLGSTNIDLTYNQILNFSVNLRIEASCLAAGTRITMADGSYKKVEDIVEGDLIRTFDHEAGQFSSAKVCLALHDGSNVPTELYFASGNTLTFAGTHGFLEESTRKYINISQSSVAQYVGKRFYNAQLGAWDELVSYKAGSKSVDRYAIYSAKHLNVIAENMLTVEDDVDFLLNIYSLDANLKADATQLAADIAQYGLCDIAKDFPEFAQHADQIEALGGQYLYIAIGKGLVPANYIEQMKSYWRGL